jgi:hypothetical protein
MNKIVKERIIYNNYDLWDDYPDEEIDTIARECECVDEDEEITDEMRTQWRYWEDEANWDAEKEMLENFFKGKTVGFFGEVGLWHGTYKAGDIGDFWTLYYKAVQDCDYIKIYDENGHMYLTCSHHDGTNHFEIKELTDDAEDYYDRWSYGNDNRKEYEVITQIYKRYSKIPRYAQNVYGYKAREYE